MDRKEEYLQAKEIVREYEKEFKIQPKIRVTYITEFGPSESKIELDDLVRFIETFKVISIEIV